MRNPKVSWSGNAKLSTAFDVIHRIILLFAWDMSEIGSLEPRSHDVSIDVRHRSFDSPHLSNLSAGCNLQPDREIWRVRWVLNLVHPSWSVHVCTPSYTVLQLYGTDLTVPGGTLHYIFDTVPLWKMYLCDFSSLYLGKYCTYVCATLFRRIKPIELYPPKQSSTYMCVVYTQPYKSMAD